MLRVMIEAGMPAFKGVKKGRREFLKTEDPFYDNGTVGLKLRLLSPA